MDLHWKILSVAASFLFLTLVFRPLEWAFPAFAIPALAPTPELLGAYRKGEIDWPDYAARFKRLQ